jgi:hypothetical protein
MNPRTYCAIVILMILNLASCKKDLGIEGSGKIIEDVRSVAYFDGVVSDGDYDVYITENGQNITEVKIKADQNFLPYISTTVSQGTLTIKNINDHFFKGERVLIYITVPYINYIDLAGKGFMTCDNVSMSHGTSQTKDMTAKISGTGDISMLGLKVTDFTAKIIGSGDIDTQGLAEAATFEIGGSGNIRGFSASNDKLEVNDCSVKITGTGNVYIYAFYTLDVYINGVGDVFYKYHPKISYDIPGDGRVIDAN